MNPSSISLLIPILLGPYQGFVTVKSFNIPQNLHNIQGGNSHNSWSSHLSYHYRAATFPAQHIHSHFRYSSPSFSTSSSETPYYPGPHTSFSDLDTAASSSSYPQWISSAPSHLSPYIINPSLESPLMSSQSEFRDQVKQKPRQFAKRYLEHFGYTQMAETTGRDKFRSAIMKFQEMHSLVPTGKINRNTMQEMMRPRCDNSDIGMDTSSALYRWSKRSFTYRVNNFPTKSPSIKPEHIRSEIARAFRVWTNVSHLRFEEIQTPNVTVDFDIGFKMTMHGDGHDFPMNTYAHAFYPDEPETWGGDIHFHENYTWLLEIPEDNATLYKNMWAQTIYPVALHEIGHSLGLEHSQNQDSIMYSTIAQFPPSFHPTPDDIRNIKKLYPPITPDRAVSRRRRPNPPLRLPHRHHHHRHHQWQ